MAAEDASSSSCNNADKFIPFRSTPLLVPINKIYTVNNISNFKLFNNSKI